MAALVRCFAVVMLMVAIAAGTAAAQPGGVPGEADGRAALHNLLQRRFPEAPAIVITKFAKTSGQTMNVNGLTVYRFGFEAVVEFPRGFGSPKRSFWGGATGGDISERVMNLQDAGFRLVQGGQAAKPQVFAANSMITFRKTDSGWAAVQ